LRWLALAAACLAVPPAVCAQNSGQDDQQTIGLLMKRINQLEEQQRELQQRIQALEAKQQRTEPEPSGAEAPTGAGDQPAARPEVHEPRGIQWRGFAEADYKVLNQRTPETGTAGFVPGSAGSFYTGDFDLFLTSRLTERSGALAELDFEEGDAQSYKVDLRRLLLSYDVNDNLRISFGRYQTGIGYYNWAFRSAAWLQTTADRPLVMEYASDGGILPTQAVGVSVTGSLPSGSLDLHYLAEYGSADTIRPDINGDGLLNDENNGNDINVGLFVRPVSAPGLQIGGSYYHDEISDLVIRSEQVQSSGFNSGNVIVPSPSARWRQSIANGYIVYVSRNFEFLNEAFVIRHALIGSTQALNTPAFYSQFSPRLRQLRPFVRYQYVNASPRNTIYDDIGRREGPSFGARYDVNEYLAFKAQLDRTARRGLPNVSGLHLQLAATF
jgi:hypothetical protein